MRESDEYQTPRDLFDFLDKRFRFTLDPCTTSDNPLRTRYFLTIYEDGLLSSWGYDSSVFMNPPYSNVEPWVEKAYMSSLDGCLVVGLLRNDPSTQWWQKWVRDKALVIDVPYRIAFVDPKLSRTTSPYNFPSAIVIWWGSFDNFPGKANRCPTS